MTPASGQPGLRVAVLLRQALHPPGYHKPLRGDPQRRRRLHLPARGQLRGEDRLRSDPAGERGLEKAECGLREGMRAKCPPLAPRFTLSFAVVKESFSNFIFSL